MSRLNCIFFLWCLLWVGPCLQGQTLSLSQGIHSYSMLENTSVLLNGRVELHVTDPGSPLLRSSVDFLSEDAWLFLDGMRPSEVVSNLLRQISIDGLRAVPGSNVRVEAYGMGTVVIPHGSGFRALEVFEDPHFQGSSLRLTGNIYYRDRSLRGLDNQISSFRLKRGYMATFAQNGNGTGLSQVYVAQDGDLEVSVLSGDLEDSISFVRVLPWRWTGKKGWAGGNEPLVEAHWNYDWDNVATSSLDVEYVPMRHNRFWNSYANINNKTGSTHALGFNEPDRPDQANITVAQALQQWPDLLASGLRLGAPAPSDAGAGLTWLYDFMDQADALRYRVDFVPVHFYKGGWSASQYYNWLRDIHLRTGRPIWVTEFNNGANWTCCEPTFGSQAQVIGDFIEMLDNASFVERYSIYNWVGPTRELVTGGSLTQAGIVYRNNDSPLAYTQEVPEGGPLSVAQYNFDNQTFDGSGFGNHAMSARLPKFGAGKSGRALELDGVNDFVRLPPNMGEGRDFNFAAWIKWDGGDQWQRIFDFGNDTSQYLFLTPRSGDDTLRFAIRNGGDEQRLDGPALQVGRWVHVAITLGRNTGTLYVNGAVVDSAADMTLNPNTFSPSKNYFGKSQFSADPLFNGSLDEVLISQTALRPNQILELMQNSAPRFNNKSLTRTAYLNQGILNPNLITEADDPDEADVLLFSKVSGPDWLRVGSNGMLTGTPTEENANEDTFVVRVTDYAGLSDFAVLKIAVQSFPEPPQLSIGWNEGELKVVWQSEYLGWRLEMKEALSNEGWVPLPESGKAYRFAVPETPGSAYFRLVYP